MLQMRTQFGIRASNCRLQIRCCRSELQDISAYAPALETDRVGLLEAPTRAVLVPGLCIHVDLESALQLTELVLRPQ